MITTLKDVFKSNSLHLVHNIHDSRNVTIQHTQARESDTSFQNRISGLHSTENCTNYVISQSVVTGQTGFAKD